MTARKYIFMTGAPGSRWSSVAHGIYWSNDIDHSDYHENRSYNSNKESAPAMHIGAYWDPGMEFDPDNWDGPFSGSGIRMVKSHTFAHKLNQLKDFGHPIVMVYRNDYECLIHWLKAGGFDITYPNYKPYYKDIPNMWIQIQKQNSDIMKFIYSNESRITKVENNYELCKSLNITNIGCGPITNYMLKDIAVYVYR